MVISLTIFFCIDGFQCPGGKEIEPADIEVFPWYWCADVTVQFVCNNRDLIEIYR